MVVPFSLLGAPTVTKQLRPRNHRLVRRFRGLLLHGNLDYTYAYHVVHLNTVFRAAGMGIVAVDAGPAHGPTGVNGSKIGLMAERAVRLDHCMDVGCNGFKGNTHLFRCPRRGRTSAVSMDITMVGGQGDRHGDVSFVEAEPACLIINGPSPRRRQTRVYLVGDEGSFFVLEGDVSRRSGGL